MKRIAQLVSLALLCTSLTLYANSIALREHHPVTYTVQKGDTLWGIAGKFLKNPLQWPRLMKANPAVQSPYLLYPGQVLEFSIHNGEPELHVVADGVIRLRPEIETTPLQAIPTLPIEYVKPFIDATRVVNRDEFNRQPYVIAQADEHVVTGAGDRVYIEGFTNPKTIAENYSLFRLGEPYVEPETHDALGYQATSVGQIYLQQPGNPATFEIIKSDREVLVGDRVMPIEDATVNLNFTPHFPPANIKGQIIAILDGTTQVGTLDNIVIDLGLQQGVQAGDVFAVYQLGATIKNPVRTTGLNNKDMRKQPKYVKLPDERAGIVIVYRVFDRVSYGLVLYERRVLHLYDVVVSPKDPTTMG